LPLGDRRAVLFDALDRKGLRRIADLFSRTIGRRVERWTLRRADAVVCLSRAGARAVEGAFDLTTPVQVIAPVADVSSNEAARSRVFAVGPVEPTTAGIVLDAIATTTGIELVVGWCSRDTEDALRLRAKKLRVTERVSYSGLLSQEELTNVYRSSILVVHWRTTETRVAALNGAACSYPIIDALSHGCAVVTNTARGARDYLRESGAGLDLERCPEQSQAIIRNALTRTSDLAVRGASAYDYASEKFSAEQVVREARAITNSAHHRHAPTSRPPHEVPLRVWTPRMKSKLRSTAAKVREILRDEGIPGLLSVVRLNLERRRSAARRHSRDRVAANEATATPSLTSVSDDGSYPAFAAWQQRILPCSLDFVRIQRTRRSWVTSPCVMGVPASVEFTKTRM
jgi:hypothetical protein